MADHGTGTNNKGNTQTLTTAAAEVFSTDVQGSADNPRWTAIQNIDTTITVYVGYGADLTTSNGWRLLPGESISMPLKSFDTVYAIASSGTPEIRWLAINQSG